MAELARQQLHRAGSGSGATSSSGNPARSKNRRHPAGSHQGARSGRPEAPADEADDGAAGTVEPVHVVDDDEQRAARRRLTEQRKRRAHHRQALRCRAGADAERGLDRDSTGPRQTAQVVGQLVDELVEPGEADVRLVLHPAAADHPDAVGRGDVGRRDEEGRLADAGLTGQQQRRALGDGLTEKGAERRQLAIAADRGLVPAVWSAIGRSPLAPDGCWLQGAVPRDPNDAHGCEAVSVI